MNGANGQEEGRYLYCVTRADIANGLDLKGLDDQPVHLVSEGGLGVVVSPSAVKRYRLIREYSLAHEMVIEQAMTHGTVLPVKFSTVAKSEDAIREKVLRDHGEELSRLLAEMDGKVELGLKVFWNNERVYADIVEHNSPIRHLRDQLAARPASATHYERIRLGRMVEEALGNRRQADADYIVDRLAPLAVETCRNTVFGETMILNGAFLVESARELDFDAAVQCLDEELAGLITIKYVGPLPPFSFVDLVIAWN